MSVKVKKDIRKIQEIVKKKGGEKICKDVVSWVHHVLRNAPRHYCYDVIATGEEMGIWTFERLPGVQKLRLKK